MKRIILAAAAASLLFSTAAFAHKPVHAEKHMRAASRVSTDQFRQSYNSFGGATEAPPTIIERMPAQPGAW